MASTLDRGSMLPPPKCRLQFSQGSQPTPSQYLNSAMNNCRLGSQSVLGSQPGAAEDGGLCQSQASVLTSQDYLPGSQDFITPAEQQYSGAADVAQAGRCMPSPAQLSPNRVKRPRNALGDPDAMDCSQPSQRAHLDPPGAPGGCPDDHAAPSRKLVRRAPSPPCARNVFVDGPEDAATDASRLAKRPPFVSRYRQEYREVAMLGQGNFSKVFRVKCKFDGMEYAVKRSFRAVTSELEARQWQQEAMAMAAAGAHPALVRYYSSWTEGGGADGQHFYILMEKCDVSLGTKMALVQQPFREAELLDILRQMAEALQHLHARGIVHMDVKPDNIYTTAEGGVKLGDFGLATCRSERANCSLQEGDARYIPQEVLKDDFSALDRADVFMLGASLYELALGTHLPSGGTQYQEIRQGRLMLMPALTAGFQKMLKWLMAPAPADRPTPARILASSLLAGKGRGAGGRGDAAKENRQNYGALALAPSQTIAC